MRLLVPLLDSDVLGLICGLLHDSKTVLAFSLVSRNLRPVAVKRLLIVKPVALVDERTIRAFHKFIFADAEARLPFLRVLTISITKVEKKTRQDVVQCILDLLERAAHLESLTLTRSRRTFKCLQDPRVAEAITQLSTLRELGLLEDCRETAAIIKSTHSISSLRTLRVSLSTLRTHHFGYHGVRIADLDAFLCHLAPTLEILDIKEPGALVLDSTGAQYPTLHSLVAPIEEGIIHTDILIAKLPGLLRLDIGMLLGGELHDDVSEQWRIRTLNQERQKMRCWTHLDRVTGDVVALFVLGLTCPVRHLVVDGFGRHQRGQMADILCATPPVCLKLSTILFYGVDVLEDPFPPEVIERLTHLALLLVYTNLPPDEGHSINRRAIVNAWWSPLLWKIINTIRSLRITHFRLAVHYRIDLTEDPEDFYSARYSKDLVRSIAELDHAQLAAELMDAVPSLQHVLLTMSGEFELGDSDMNSDSQDPDFYMDVGGRTQRRGRWSAHSAWRNTCGGSPGAEAPSRLDVEAVEEMLLDENLMLSDADNVSGSLCPMAARGPDACARVPDYLERGGNSTMASF